MSAIRANWSEHHTFLATNVHQPETIAEVQELVASHAKIGVFGARHSFNGIADSPGDLLSLEHLDRVVAIDAERGTATVEGGIRYAQLGPQLHQAGFALHNLASLPHISVAGAVSTATHGSGDRNANLATAVSALDLVTANGEIISLSRERDGERFLGAVVGLGALGVIVRLTLDLQPSFAVRQEVYEDLSLDRLDAGFDAVMAGAYSVSLFTNWQSPSSQVWMKRRGADEAAPETRFDARLATVQRHPTNDASAATWTEQLGIPGPWYERLTHFRAEFQPGTGAELQSEYFVPRQHARATLRAIAGLQDRIAPILKAAEIRTIAADDLWMSTCQGQDRVAFHFTWDHDWPAVSAVLPLIEARIAPYAARPHWGKLFTQDAAYIRSLYPKRPEFVALARDLDPTGKFRNDFLDRYVFGEE